MPKGVDTAMAVCTYLGCCWATLKVEEVQGLTRSRGVRAHTSIVILVDLVVKSMELTLHTASRW